MFSVSTYHQILCNLKFHDLCLQAMTLRQTFLNAFAGRVAYDLLVNFNANFGHVRWKKLKLHRVDDDYSLRKSAEIILQEETLHRWFSFCTIGCFSRASFFLPHCRLVNSNFSHFAWIFFFFYFLFMFSNCGRMFFKSFLSMRTENLIICDLTETEKKRRRKLLFRIMFVVHLFPIDENVCFALSRPLTE